MRYFDEAQTLWQTYVPPRGQAATVQGELIRAVEKLRDEAQRNGNVNWRGDHALLVEFIRRSRSTNNPSGRSIADDLDVEPHQSAPHPRPRLETSAYVPVARSGGNEATGQGFWNHEG